MPGPVHDRGATAEKAKARKRRKRPCRSAPATPTGITLNFGKRWSDRETHWRAVSRATAVTLDVAGRTISVEGYQVQLRATDASGVPVELDSGDAAVWRVDIAGDDELRAVFPELPRPRTWYFQTRWRALNRVQGVRCWSAWSAWTAATQPVSGALTGPPAPTGNAGTFVRTDTSKGDPFLYRQTWNEVPSYTPTDGDLEDGADQYVIQLAVSTDGGTSTLNTRRHYIAAKEDGTGDTTRTYDWTNAIRRGRHYRSRVKAVKNGVHGAYSSWTAWRTPSTDVGSGPNAVTGVVTTRPRARVLLTTWNEPAVGEDVDGFKVEVRRNGALVETAYVRNRRYRYDVPEADKGKTHRVRVHAIDQDGNLSSQTEGADTAEGGNLSGEVIVQGTLSGPLSFGDGQVNVDGTVTLPEQPVTGFFTPAPRQASSFSNNASGTNIAWTPSKNTAKGSLLLAVLLYNGAAATVTAPSGWTLVGAEQAQGNVRMRVYKREDAPIQLKDVAIAWTLSAARTGRMLSGLEVTGAQLEDVTASATATLPTNLASTGTTATTTQAAEFALAVFAAVYPDTFGTAAHIDATNGFATLLELEDSSGASDAVDLVTTWKVLTATGAQSSVLEYLAPGTTFSGLMGRVVTFKAKAAPGTLVAPGAGLAVGAVTLLSQPRLAAMAPDGVLHLPGFHPGFRATRATAQGITGGGTWIDADWVAAEINDGGMMELANDRLLVPVGLAGRWWLEARVTWEGNATGNRQMRIVKDPAGAAIMLDKARMSNLTAQEEVLWCGTFVELAEGDIVKVQVQQNSGVTLSLQPGYELKRFAGYFVGRSA